MFKFQKAYKAYKEYLKIVNSNKDALQELHNIRLNDVGEMYTVIDTSVEDPVYGKELAKKEALNYLKNLNEYFISLNIIDLIEYKDEIIEDEHILLYWEFKHLDIKKYTYYYRLIRLISIVSLSIISLLTISAQIISKII